MKLHEAVAVLTGVRDHTLPIEIALLWFDGQIKLATAQAELDGANKMRSVMTGGRLT